DSKAYIESSALVRAQDYSAIRSLCSDIKSGISHLDIGSGIGSHAVYSLKGFNSCFYSIEAVPHTYAVQRDFYKFLSEGNPTYLDLVECENFNLNSSEMRTLVNSSGKYKIKHVPSWHFGLINDNSMDLVTATWVLNEVTFSGIMWLISQCSRVLKKGGYFYIRDSSKLKPLRHQINYDELLLDLGFKEAGRVDVRNRIDLHGIPRAYYKDTESSYSFLELVDKCIGKFGITVHGGDYVQNLPVGCK
ncbi:MAG: class I SAM-dependent methyltransferase, partial [Thermodesulfovibrionia bacterium]|nr:class I SAM-dependent methyltransferase [Thermodesulfovibrionia bacterium]